MQRKWAIRWTLYLATVAIVFSSLEVPALISPASGDTLSEFLRYILSMWPAGAALFVGALAWFGWHIVGKQ